MKNHINGPNFQAVPVLFVAPASSSQFFCSIQSVFMLLCCFCPGSLELHQLPSGSLPSLPVFPLSKPSRPHPDSLYTLELFSPVCSSLSPNFSFPSLLFPQPKSPLWPTLFSSTSAALSWVVSIVVLQKDERHLPHISFSFLTGNSAILAVTAPEAMGQPGQYCLRFIKRIKISLKQRNGLQNTF